VGCNNNSNDNTTTSTATTTTTTTTMTDNNNNTDNNNDNYTTYQRHPQPRLNDYNHQPIAEALSSRSSGRFWTGMVGAQTGP
jgi:hypothetical protein